MRNVPFLAATLTLALGMALTLMPARTQPAPQTPRDTRQLVKLPPMMQQHMLRNMRDHLRALNEILDALSRGDTASAARVAEERLGMSSLNRHGASHLAQFMPPDMRAIGTQMHKAASRFVITAQNAELTPGRESLHATYGALKELTDQCIACHDSFRLR